MFTLIMRSCVYTIQALLQLSVATVMCLETVCAHMHNDKYFFNQNLSHGILLDENFPICSILIILLCRLNPCMPTNV